MKTLKCVITDETIQDADPNANPAVLEINAPTGAKFKITDTKLYVSVATLSNEDANKILKQLKTGFWRTIKWNKCGSEMSNQTKINNLIRHFIKSIDYLFCRLRMNNIELLFQSIIHQKLK